MKKPLSILILLVLALGLGACSSIPAGDVGDSANYGSSTPR
jgi:hypothetical protein